MATETCYPIFDLDEHNEKKVVGFAKLAKNRRPTFEGLEPVMVLRSADSMGNAQFKVTYKMANGTVQIILLKEPQG